MPKYSEEETALRDYYIDEYILCMKYHIQNEKPLAMLKRVSYVVEKALKWDFETFIHVHDFSRHKNPKRDVYYNMDGPLDQELINSIYKKNGYKKYKGNFYLIEEYNKLMEEIRINEEAEKERFIRVSILDEVKNITKEIKDKLG